MIFPPEFQNREFLLYDAPATVESLIRYIIAVYADADTVEQGEALIRADFGLDEVPNKTG